MHTVLTIAGFDPSSGAGVTADLMVFAAHGLFGTSCITALTVQSTLGVKASHPVSSEVVHDTLEYLDADLPPSGIKIGMLATAANSCEIIRYLDKYKVTDVVKNNLPRPYIVLDPVLRSSSGRELIAPEGLDVMRQHLLPLVDWITPNLKELAILSGEAVEEREDIAKASAILQKRTAILVAGRRLGIVVTGGHHDPPDDYMLTPDGEEFWFPGTRVETTSTHGTGCAFSSAFLCRLVLGESPFDACVAAKTYVAGALGHALPMGHGAGPISHLWKIHEVKD
jgi:hydroxymethylpyrimidine/phosphomethylpyrimidine kinase